METVARPLHRDAATVVFVDVVESVRLIADDELANVQKIRSLLTQLRNEAVPAQQGTVVEQRGDGLLLRFAHTRQALAFARQAHQLAQRTSPPNAATLRLRAGLHRTEFLTDDAALYGAGINLAARIAAMGEPGDTLLSAAARDELNAELDGVLQDLGPCHLKHVDEPQRLFRHRVEPSATDAGLEACISARMRLRPTLVVVPIREAGLPGTAAPPIGLGDVVTDQLTRQLSQSDLLHVISALSANALRGRDLSLDTLYRHLRADYVLQGELLGHADGTQPGQRLHWQARLWRRGVGEPIWSHTVQGAAMDALSAHSELLGSVVQAVGQRILQVEQRAARATQALPNLAAHTLYLNAVDLLHRFSVPEFERAGQMLGALSDRAPRHAEPLAWLARWHVFKVVQGWSSDSQSDGLQALRYSERALDRDPHSSLALTMAGSVHAGVRRDPQAAQGFYAQALEHNPNDSLAWLMSGVAQGFMTAREPALVASEMALGLAPIDPTRHYYDALAATAALRASEYERCIVLAGRSIAANGSHGSSYRAKAIAEVLLGRVDDARVTVENLLRVEPHFTLQTYLARVPPHEAKTPEFAAALKVAGLPLQ